MQRFLPKLDTLQTVELAEGVEIRLRIAGPLVRGYAFMVDLLIRAVILMGLSFLFTFIGVLSSSGFGTGLMLLSWFLISWFYHVFFEYGRKGATLGKRAMKLRVVQPSGAPITFGQAVIRNFMRFVDAFPSIMLAGGGMGFPSYGFAVASCLLTKRFQRLGDLAANTLVIYDRPYLPPVLPRQEIVEGISPGIVLSKEEEAALINFDDRAATWSQERRIELTNYLGMLTGATGPEGMKKVAAMAQWLRENR